MNVAAYFGVLVSAMIPWFELFAIPPAIALGLSPIPVGVLAAIGNSVVTVALVFGWERLSAWWWRRRGRIPGAASKRSERARRVFDRYGVPGLALQGPLLSGMYVAALVALRLGAPRNRVLAWSLAGIALWSVVFVVATKVGVDLR